MIEFDWRVEGVILFGSCSEAAVVAAGLLGLAGRVVMGVGVVGRLPELELSGGVRLASFMTSEGGPAWAVFDRRGAAERWVSVEGGVLVMGSGSG